MRIAKSKNMKNSAVSKAELKMALVTKRLAMLQDHHEIVPVLSQVSPLQVLPNESHPLQCESAKLLMDPSDDTLSEDVLIPKSSKNRIKFGSHKRARIISDDESYEDEEHMVSVPPPRKKGRTKQKMIKINDPSNDENVAIDNPRRQKRMDLIEPSSMGEKSSSMKRPEEVQANLAAESPSFIKPMLKSHVSGGFWLGLPRNFCDDHLPIRDCTIVLVDEAGKEFDTVYLARKAGLSGGWRGFSIYHSLLEGDVLVFHLISRMTFKIYIIREQNFGEVDGALGLLTLDSRVGQHKSDDQTETVLQIEDNYTLVSQSSSDNIDLGSEIHDGIYFSDSSINFEEVKSFHNFNIIIDGLKIDSKFSVSTKQKYYKLCCSQNSFLHEHILKGLNCQLVVGIISETIKISDAIKSCKTGCSISNEDLQIWEKTLQGFEFLGMKVEFLRARINKLLGGVVESDESKMLKESIVKRSVVGERMKGLEGKFTQLKEIMEKIDLEMDAEITMASVWKQKVMGKGVTGGVVC
ncbi:B3 domain-containing protein Os01g0234100 isoform X3 [Spinacia oleracea]|uniref:B3 domain-containing protein Os01g0234100 isoform X3 n=1 Tax=Spinacia oleracea TaxID=3562 RepID=A0ABM3RMX8_SPIOL|nr:B3 domain-containing protein Os01g0234100-like isoform X3 [Spinacia oleracea]